MPCCACSIYRSVCIRLHVCLHIYHVTSQGLCWPTDVDPTQSRDVRCSGRIIRNTGNTVSIGRVYEWAALSDDQMRQREAPRSEVRPTCQPASQPSQFNSMTPNDGTRQQSNGAKTQAWFRSFSWSTAIDGGSLHRTITNMYHSGTRLRDTDYRRHYMPSVG